MSIFIIQPNDEAAMKRSEMERLQSEFNTMIGLASNLYDDIPGGAKTTAVATLSSIASFSGETTTNQINALAIQLQLACVALNWAIEEIIRLKNGSGGD